MSNPEGGYAPEPDDELKSDKDKKGFSAARIAAGLGLVLVGTAGVTEAVQDYEGLEASHEPGHAASQMAEQLQTPGGPVKVFAGTVELTSRSFQSFGENHPLLETPNAAGPTEAPTVLEQSEGHGIKLVNPVVVERPDGAYLMGLEQSQDHPGEVQPVFVKAVEGDGWHAESAGGTTLGTVSSPKHVVTPDGHTSLVAQAKLTDGRTIDVGIIVHDSSNSPAAS